MNDQVEVEKIAQRYAGIGVDVLGRRARLEAAILAYGEAVRREAGLVAVDAVMRHDVSLVNVSLRRAIAKDVEAAIRAAAVKGERQGG